MAERIRIAIQKNGRLCEKSLELLKKCGLKFGCDSRVLNENCSNFPVSFIYVRDDDIPSYVDKGVADIGIVGLNEVEEQCLNLDVVRNLNFAKCRLSIAVPDWFNYTNIKDLEGCRVATSYPNLLKKCLKKYDVSVNPVFVSGSVEVTPQIGVADAICDLVSTGTTLTMNGLKEAKPIFFSSAVMIARPNYKNEILHRLLRRLDAVILADNYKYVMFNLPEEQIQAVANLVGGVKSPTVTNLFEKGWVSVQIVVEEDRFWEVFEKLKELGAQGILVTPIEQMTR